MWSLFLFACVIVLLRLVYVYCNTFYYSRDEMNSLSLMLILGSGGHTSELLFLTDSLFSSDFIRKLKRIYVAADSDAHSLVRAVKFEERKEGEKVFETVARARNVGQSWLTTPFTLLFSFYDAARLFWRYRPSMIICNGPGTCVPICYFSWLCKLFGFATTKIIFIESFCRVDQLSLSGKLLLPIANRFLVLWPQLVTHYPVEYIGQLL